MGAVHVSCAVGRQTWRRSAFPSLNGNSGLHVGVAQSSTDNGAPVVQWNDVNVDDQLWKIVRIN